ncbi:hypothetical protein D3C72_2569950 [compost metagenome]
MAQPSQVPISQARPLPKTSRTASSMKLRAVTWAKCQGPPSWALYQTTVPKAKISV